MALVTAPILLVTGPPGAGKSTVAKLLARRWARAVHLHTDDFYAWVVSGYVDPWKPEAQAQNVALISAMAAAAARIAAAGYQVVVDGILGPWFLDPWRELSEPVAYVVLRPSVDVAEQRAAARGDHPLKDLSVVGVMHAAFADLGALESHALDTSSMAPAETADEVLRRLHAGLLALD
jgi:broad-specificity NMP kinase